MSTNISKQSGNQSINFNEILINPYKKCTLKHTIHIDILGYIMYVRKKGGKQYEKNRKPNEKYLWLYVYMQ